MDVSAKAMASAQDEAGEIISERMAIEEIRELLTEMHEDRENGDSWKVRKPNQETEIEPDPRLGWSPEVSYSSPANV